jgi:glycosyltransferase involved in cell wall biosynthesis
MTDRKTRVLLISANDRLAAALAQRGDMVVHSLKEQDGTIAAYFDSKSAWNLDVDYAGGRKLSLRGVQAVREAIRRTQADVVHAFMSRSLAHATLAAATLRKNPPRIVSFRGILATPHVWDPVQWITYRCPLVAAHACESEAVREAMIASGVDAARCGVVYNCVARTLKPVGRSEARRTWDVPKNAFVIATVANVRPVKGIDLLLRAALECVDLPNVYFVVMGKVCDRRVAKLAADPRIARRVRLTGLLKNAADLVAGADLFVMPSRSEGLCRALLEAMSHGLCPVVSDAGGMKEVVRHGQDGLVFPRGNVPALAAALQRLHGDRGLLAALGQSAQRRMNDFTPAAMAERLAGLYRTVMSESAPAKSRAA